MNILIVSHYIAPIQAVASIRWTKIAKYLKKQHEDIHITVITDEKNFDDKSSGIPLSKIDPLLSVDVKNFDEVVEVPYGRAYKFYKRKLYLYKVKKNRDIEYHKNSVDSMGGKKGIKRLLKETESFLRVDYLENRIIANNIYRNIKNTEKYDVIISTFSPAWTHLVARRIKEKNNKALWIADFRDSYADDIADCPIAFRYHKKFVKKYCAKANIVTRVNNELVLFENINQKVVTVYNGYDLDEKIEKQKSSKFSFAFTGLLAGDERDFSELFRVISELIEDNTIIPEDVEFYYAGTTGEVFTNQARKYGMEKLVKDYGLVKREEALHIQSKSLFLLMANANTSTLKCEWSGKMYEYMMAEKPIIYFVTGTIPYSLPSKNIGKLGGFCYEYLRDEELHVALKEYISKKYHEWKKNGDVLIDRDMEYIEQFDYSKIADKIWNIIENGRK